MRQSVLRAGAIALAAVGLMGASALGAAPRRDARYRGSGTLYTNNAPHWLKDAGKEAISFRTSASGQRVLSFKGAFAYYCGGGKADVTARTIPITAKGAFGYRFVVPRPTSKAYVAISGTFLSGGRASVSYLVDYVATGQRVAHPYSTSNPRTLGCASWVRGTVKAG